MAATPTADRPGGGPAGQSGRRPPTVRRVLTVVASAAIAVALLVGVLPELADFSEVWETIRRLEPAAVSLLVALTAWNIVTYQFLIMAALPGLPWSQAFMVGQISTAVANTIPAGAAVGIGVTYAMFSSYGYTASSIGVAAALTGLWNTFVKLGLPIVALAILAFQGNPNPAMLGAALAGLALLAGAVIALALVVKSDRLAGRVGSATATVASMLVRPFGRGPFTGWEVAVRSFRAKTAGVLTRRWPWLTFTALLSHLSLFVLLLASLRAVGVSPDEVTWAEALAAFASVRLVTALPITPGGIGLVEVGMTGALALAGGEGVEVVAGVLVFRVLSYAVQVPVGVVCWVLWRATTKRTTPVEEPAA